MPAAGGCWSVVLTGVRAVRLLALTVWLGGLIFFAAVLAPVAFSPEVVGQTHSFAVPGTIVGTALRRLHAIGLVCGVVLLLGSIAIGVRAGRRRLLRAEMVAIGVMMLLTAYSQFSIVPRMEADRRAVGDIEDVPRGSPYREEFDRLHGLSVQVESGVQVAGLVLVVLVAAEGRTAKSA